jgi:Domain of unknown function (DUF4395)
MRRLFTFPNPVNDFAARTVATGVVVMSVFYLITGWMWILIPLCFGFWARVLTGPTLSPLGQLATRVVAPRISGTPRLTSGPPKRFAQAIGVAFSTTALVLALGVGASPAKVVIAVLTIAAFLEAAFGFCLGCKVFAILMKLGAIPESVCAECADLSLRYPTLSK